MRLLFLCNTFLNMGFFDSSFRLTQNDSTKLPLCCRLRLHGVCNEGSHVAKHHCVNIVISSVVERSLAIIHTVEISPFR